MGSAVMGGTAVWQLLDIIYFISLGIPFKNFMYNLLSYILELFAGISFQIFMFNG